MTKPNEDLKRIAAREIARRIATNGEQQFEDEEAFVRAYGQAALEMHSAGYLSSPLEELGYITAPFTFEGRDWLETRGLTIRRSNTPSD